jgi:hypothetical protein
MSDIDDHYADLYAPWEDGGLAVEAEITVGDGTNEQTETVMVIDKREGITAEFGEAAHHVGKPAVRVRNSELAEHGWTPAVLKGGTIQAGDFKHMIEGHIPRPGPALHSGESYLILGRKLA